MQRTIRLLSYLVLLSLLLALTVSVALAARDWIENGALLVYPATDAAITQYDEVVVEYEYRFVAEAGTASAQLIGYSDAACGNGNDPWGGVPVSQLATQQASALDGFAKLTLSPDAAMLTAAINSVTVEIRLSETNHNKVNRVDYYCRTVDHAASEAGAAVPEGQADLEETLSSYAIVLNAVTPGYVLRDMTQFGSLTTGSQVSAEVAYKFWQTPGEIRVDLKALPESCHNRLFQKSVSTPEQWTAVSQVLTVQANAMQNLDTFELTVSAIPADAKAIALGASTWENGVQTSQATMLSCFDVQDDTINLLDINPGFVLGSEGDVRRIGLIEPNELTTAQMSFEFDAVPGDVTLRLMGLDSPCQHWLFNLSSEPIPANSYPVSAETTQSFSQLQNNATFELFNDQMRPSTKSVYLEARSFENGVETEHNVFLACSNVGQR